ncbi:glycoside hydrolase family 12 protein, partial [Suillus luteus UH-Slu-Lm8-n1]
TTPITGQFDSVNVGEYSLLNNLWGEYDAASGSQTSQITSLNGDYIAWTTAYTWIGGGPDQVKSYANVQLNYGINQQLSAISSLPTDWQWSLSNEDIVADVAYDLFTSWSPGGSNVNEIMIWLANINSGPISANYDAEGAVPIAKNISLEGSTWNLYSGSNGVNQVYSFLLTSGTTQSFSGDIYSFFSYLIDNEGLNTAQYLTCAQAGTEVFSGTANLTT